ncbi:hypothetical protein KI387_035272, partial [Taxus chinensis]
CPELVIACAEHYDPEGRGIFKDNREPFLLITPEHIEEFLSIPDFPENADITRQSTQEFWDEEPLTWTKI